MVELNTEYIINKLGEEQGTEIINGSKVCPATCHRDVIFLHH